MATWVNLLDVIYPTGSIYFSRSATSPASTIGGSWTQIKGAVLAACGANSFATNKYGGSLKISINQMPSHTHTTQFNQTASPYTASSGNQFFGGYTTPTDPWPTGATGGGQTICLTTTEYTSGIELHNYITSLGGDLVGYLG